MIRLIDILLEDTLTERSFIKKIGDFITGRKTAPEVKPYVERKPGDVWQTASGRWVGMNRNGNVSYYATREAAETYSKKEPRKQKPFDTTPVKIPEPDVPYGHHFMPKPNTEPTRRKRRVGRIGIGGGGFTFGGGGGFSGGGGGSSF